MALRIGIDPGSTTTGIFVWDTLKQKKVASKTLGYLKTLSFVDHWPPEAVEMVVIEDPGLNKFIYARNRTGNPRADGRIARNVGMNQQIAAFLIETLQQRGYTVRRVKPTPKHRKWTPEFYQAATGDRQRVSQHVRDAARIAV